MVNIGSVHSENDLQIALLRSREFEKLGSTIRSQVKRAGMLYLQYLRSYKPRKN